MYAFENLRICRIKSPTCFEGEVIITLCSSINIEHAIQADSLTYMLTTISMVYMYLSLADLSVKMIQQRAFCLSDLTMHGCFG